jgi:hypothetical protein
LAVLLPKFLQEISQTAWWRIIRLVEMPMMSVEMEIMERLKVLRLPRIDLTMLIQHITLMDLLG